MSEIHCSSPASGGEVKLLTFAVEYIHRSVSVRHRAARSRCANLAIGTRRPLLASLGWNWILSERP